MAQPFHTYVLILRPLVQDGVECLRDFEVILVLGGERSQFRFLQRAVVGDPIGYDRFCHRPFLLASLSPHTIRNTSRFLRATCTEDSSAKLCLLYRIDPALTAHVLRSRIAAHPEAIRASNGIDANVTRAKRCFQQTIRSRFILSQLFFQHYCLYCCVLDDLEQFTAANHSLNSIYTAREIGK